MVGEFKTILLLLLLPINLLAMENTQQEEQTKRVIEACVTEQNANVCALPAESKQQDCQRSEQQASSAKENKEITQARSLSFVAPLQKQTVETSSCEQSASEQKQEDHSSMKLSTVPVTGKGHSFQENAHKLIFLEQQVAVPKHSQSVYVQANYENEAISSSCAVGEVIDCCEQGRSQIIAARMKEDKALTSSQLIDHIQELHEQNLELLEEYEEKVRTPGLPRSSLERLEGDFDKVSKDADLLAKVDEEESISKLATLSAGELNMLVARLTKLQAEVQDAMWEGPYARKLNATNAVMTQRLERIKKKANEVRCETEYHDEPMSSNKGIAQLEDERQQAIVQCLQRAEVLSVDQLREQMQKLNIQKDLLIEEFSRKISESGFPVSSLCRLEIELDSDVDKINLRIQAYATALQNKLMQLSIDQSQDFRIQQCEKHDLVVRKTAASIPFKNVTITELQPEASVQCTNKQPAKVSSQNAAMANVTGQQGASQQAVGNSNSVQVNVGINTSQSEVKVDQPNVSSYEEIAKKTPVGIRPMQQQAGKQCNFVMSAASHEQLGQLKPLERSLTGAISAEASKWTNGTSWNHASRYLNKMWPELHRISSFVDKECASKPFASQLAKTAVESRSELQKMYEGLKEDQLVVGKCFAAMNELGKSYFWAPGTRCQVEHFNRVFPALKHYYQSLESMAEDIETRYKVTPVTVTELAERYEREVYKKNRIYDNSFDGFISKYCKALLGGFISVKTGVVYGDGKPQISVEALGKHCAFDLHNEQQDHAALQAIKEQHANLTERQKPVATITASQTAASSTRQMQQDHVVPLAEIVKNVGELKKYSADHVDSINVPELKLFSETADQLIFFGDKLAREGISDRANQLFECAALVAQEGSTLCKSNENVVVNTAICISLQPLVQEASTVTDRVKQEFLLDTITTATSGAKVVQALKATGDDRVAALINEAITNKLVAIREVLVPSGNKAPTSVRVEQERLHTLAAAIEAEQTYLREMIMRGDGEESLAIAGASSEAQLRVLKGVAKGVGDGVVCLVDPRSMVQGTEQLIKAGCFVVKQLGRLEAYQEALEHGDQELANRFEAEFRADNSQVVEAAAQWYENFKQLSAEEQARALSAFGTTLLFGKSIASVQMKVIGAGLNGISRGATTVANAFANHPIAMTPEGIGVAVKVADSAETAELFATEKMASGAQKAANKVVETAEVVEKAGVSAKAGEARSLDGFKFTRFADNRLKWHYDKHVVDRMEWGKDILMTTEEYLKKAQDLINSPIGGDVEGFTSKNGFTFRYNKATNEFATANPEGIIETLYRPKVGRTYWEEQIAKYK